jgi:retinol dehydrogenase 12
MDEPPPMTNRHVLITGGTDGIGKETATALARAGATLTIVARDSDRGRRARADILAAAPGADVIFIEADIGLMSSVRRLAQSYRQQRPKLDVLMHSAGIIDMARPMTTEGIERNFAVNYLGRYLLTSLLDDLLQQDARVLALATAGVQPIRFDFDAVTRASGMSGFRAYQQSQAANDVWGAGLADRLAPRGVRVAVIAPGIVKTGIRSAHKAPLWLKLFDLLATPFAISVRRGAETPIRLASDPDWPPKGLFFGSDMKLIKVSEKTRDPTMRADLEKISAKLAVTGDARLRE